MNYAGEPKTHFQRNLRSKLKCNQLKDHICKNMNPLNELRISLIPKEAGADWRDLPNTVIT